MWNAALEGRYQLVVSPAIIREMAEVFRFHFAWQDDRVRKAVRVVAQVALVIAPKTELDVVEADPDDNRILECAVDGKADIVVSNDHHLLDMRKYGHIYPEAGHLIPGQTAAILEFLHSILSPCEQSHC